MQGGIKPVAGAIAGENTAGAVGAVSSRGELDYGHSRIRIAKAIQRSGPVALALIAAWRVGRALLAPLD